jgi:hypothetical protein
VFAPGEGSFVAGLALSIAQDRIVAVEAGCNTPEQLMLDGVQELQVIWRPSPNRVLSSMP